MTTTSINNLKVAIIDYINYVVKANTTGNSTYESVSNNVWREQIAPYVKNEAITTWELDIKKKFVDNPYCRYAISEKQAYCLARAYAQLNPETITA